MRADDVQILMVPGWTNSGPDHWQSRWERKLAAARRIEMPDFNRPVRVDWVGAIAEAVRVSEKPALLVAHSCGVLAVAHAAAVLPREKVAGAMLVAPTDLLEEAAVASFLAECGEGVARPVGFEPLPMEALPFPSLVVASRNDPFCRWDTAQAVSTAWGAALMDAGEAGHINTAAGYGPWPEGAMRLASFLKRL
jgi:hypothetical protein